MTNESKRHGVDTLFVVVSAIVTVVTDSQIVLEPVAGVRVGAVTIPVGLTVVVAATNTREELSGVIVLINLIHQSNEVKSMANVTAYLVCNVILRIRVHRSRVVHCVSHIHIVSSL